jgi:hypothetical protein
MYDSVVVMVSNVNEFIVVWAFVVVVHPKRTNGSIINNIMSRNDDVVGEEESIMVGVVVGTLIFFFI